GVSELQKNISIFKNLDETIHIIDKKTKEVLALVLPKPKMQKHTLTEALGGILQVKHPIKKYENIDEMIDDAYEQEMKEKYGI
nr:hypothetical protein [Campylobacterota bacterium]